jgi:hypothetical protein
MFNVQNCDSYINLNYYYCNYTINNNSFIRLFSTTFHYRLHFLIWKYS